MNRSYDDEILRNRIHILNIVLNNNDTYIIKYINDYKTFISNIPIYNKISIDFVKKFYELYLEKIKEIYQQKKNYFEVLPHLEIMKSINLYFN